MKKAVLLVDGGHLRAMAKQFQINWGADFVSEFCGSITASDEELCKCLFYDCKPYNGEIAQPISGTNRVFSASPKWIDDLSQRDLFAVRLGELRFRGWAARPHYLGPPTIDAHFRPNFEQKGVDMRIGIDIANISNGRTYDRILLVSSDTDMIPAMKEARKAGIQIAIYQLPFRPQRAHRDKLKVDLKGHADFVRDASWPAKYLTPPATANTPSTSG